MESPAKKVEYRDIAGFPGYRIGSDGSVWTCRAPQSSGCGKVYWVLGNTWRQMAVELPTRSTKYVSIRLQRPDGTKSHVNVHTLVLVAFRGPRPLNQMGRHLNDNRLDNTLGNLVWGTHLENVADAVRHQLHARGSRQHSSRLVAHDVIAIRRDYQLGIMNMTELGIRHRVHKSSIRAIIRRETWGHLPDIEAGRRRYLESKGILRPELAALTPKE